MRFHYKNICEYESEILKLKNEINEETYNKEEWNKGHLLSILRDLKEEYKRFQEIQRFQIKNLTDYENELKILNKKIYTNGIKNADKDILSIYVELFEEYERFKKYWLKVYKQRKNTAIKKNDLGFYTSSNTLTVI
jgi:hypothetical protein